MRAEDEIERVARLSYGRLVAVLTARAGGVAAAQDALCDALLRALEVWPARGVPDRPEAWLIATARNRLTDAGRRAGTAQAAAEALRLLADERAERERSAAVDPTLELMLVCAHPAIDARMRAPLMLQLVLGLDARRMAGVFLIPPGTLGQRLTRARAKIEAACIGWAQPHGEELAPRLGHVLDAIYAAFTVGADGEGASDAKTSTLAREALWLGTLVARLTPREPEAQGLLALMLHTMARRPTRLGPDGAFTPLEDQDPSSWDAALLAEADRAMARAAAAPTLGRYQLEAAIAAAQADRRHGRPTDWRAIAALHRGLLALHPSTGARTSLAAALLEAGEAAEALAILDAADPAKVVAYQPWWAVRAHVLARLRENAAAVAAFDRAVALTADPAVAAFLARRCAAATSGGDA